MEIRFAPEVEKKLNDLATQSGRDASDVLQDALAGYFAEVGQAREMIDRRYDDVKNGKVKLISGDEVEAYFREKTIAARNFPSRS